jgi:DNA polymerase-3 subunit beta
VQEEGTTTVPAKTFSDLVGVLRQDKVELSVPEPEEGKVPTIYIKGLGTQSTIKGMDPSEYPNALPGAEGELFPSTSMPRRSKK